MILVTTTLDLNLRQGVFSHEYKKIERSDSRSTICFSHKYKVRGHEKKKNRKRAIFHVLVSRYMNIHCTHFRGPGIFLLCLGSEGLARAKHITLSISIALASHNV